MTASEPRSEKELKRALLDTPFTFDPNRGLPRPPEGFVRDATPTEEPPAELDDLLDDFNVAINWLHAPIEDFEDTDQCPYATREEAEAAIRAARAALVGLYERQQEELEHEHVSYAHEYNWRVSLESQLERQREEIANLLDACRRADASLAKALLDVERLKAEQLEIVGEVAERFKPKHRKSCTCGDCQWWTVRASDARKAALRRRSHSDHPPVSEKP